MEGLVSGISGPKFGEGNPNQNPMATTIVSSRIPRSFSNMFESCETAFRLISEGKEREARESFPLEYYLVKKYLFSNLEVFKTQLENKLSM